MKTSEFLVLLGLLVASGAHAEEEGKGRKALRTAEQGAQAAGKGIEKGAEATGKGVNQAADSVGRTTQKADGWLSEKLRLKSRGKNAPADPLKDSRP